LVMGNDNYTTVSKLQKAGNDADAMARELKAAGFAVTLQRDLNYRNMVKVIESFADGITGGDEVVVFLCRARRSDQGGKLSIASRYRS